MQCQLCTSSNENILYQSKLCRVIAIHDYYYPGFIRVIANSHVKELTDLSDIEAQEMFAIILNVEKIMRKSLNPDKINIATLGNVIPHLHWHIIPRFHDDRHFPNPIWGDVANQLYIPSKQLTSACANFQAILKTNLN